MFVVETESCLPDRVTNVFFFCFYFCFSCFVCPCVHVIVQIIAKYWKMHPWFTSTFNTPPERLVSFTPSFGVKFGLMICFDIAFPSPGPALRKNGISHFPYAAVRAVSS